MLSRHNQPAGLKSTSSHLIRALPHAGSAIVLALAISGCAGVTTNQPTPTSSSCSSDEFYFPRGTFPAAHPASDEMRRRWYATPLARLGEPSLSCGDWPAETYRLIWLHHLAHPVVIRVMRSDDRVEAYAFQLSGSGGGDPGLLLYQAHKELTVADWERLESSLRQSRFWSLPTSGNMYAAHGEQWIVEGRRNNSYHIVDRWTPSAGAYRNLGVLFFDLVEWQRPYSSDY